MSEASFYWYRISSNTYWVISFSSFWWRCCRRLKSSLASSDIAGLYVWSCALLYSGIKDMASTRFKVLGNGISRARITWSAKGGLRLLRIDSRWLLENEIASSSTTSLWVRRWAALYKLNRPFGSLVIQLLKLPSSFLNLSNSSAPYT